MSPEVDSSKIINLYLSSISPPQTIAVSLLYTVGLIRLCTSLEHAIPADW